jgi:hypothetical protein
VVRQPGSEKLQLTTTYVRAADGLVESVIEADATGEERTTTFTYRDAERHYPHVIKNALGQETVLAFDPRFGRPVAALDPNGLLALFGHDDFGRPSVVLKPDGSRTRTVYEVGSEPNRPVVIDTFEVGGARKRVELDVLGRASRVRSFGFGNQELVERFTYNDLGLIATHTRPSSASPPSERFTYDPLGRVIEHTDFVDEVTTRCYVGLTSCTRDPRGNVRCEVKDGQGRPIRVNAPVALPCEAAANAASVSDATTYAYGPFGYLEVVRDRAGNETVAADLAFS